MLHVRVAPIRLLAVLFSIAVFVVGCPPSSPSTVTVPNVVGKTQIAAQSTLTGGSLVVGTVTQAFSGTVPAGTVISQDPAAGSKVAPGTTVSLLVSKGKPEIAIRSVDELQKIGNDPAYPLDGSYYLTKNIDASNTASWNGGMGFVPIGNLETSGFTHGFAGTFDGRGYVISGLVINGPNKNAFGLFSRIAEDGEVRNLGLEDGSVSGEGLNEQNSGLIGGLVGVNDGKVTNCYTTGPASSIIRVDINRGYSEVGGLVGRNNGTISDCYATGEISGGSGTRMVQAGGSYLHFSDHYAGGLAGTNYGSITDSYATGAVNGTSADTLAFGQPRAGGLVGRNFGDGSVVDCHATGAVSGTGGLIGQNDGTVTSCYATGEVSGAGGLIGTNTEAGTVVSCYATGAVWGTGSTDNDVGGLVGINGGTVTDCYVNGTVTGGFFVGGLVGHNYGLVTGCNATGGVLAVAHTFKVVGGLVGWNSEAVTRCYATGSVVISGSANGVCGGLAGFNGGTVTACYATGSVWSTDNGSVHRYVGGLVGENSSFLIDCYAAGLVGGSVNSYSRVGGLVGRNTTGTVTHSFWDVEASGQAISEGGTGKTTAQMMMETTFTQAGWDFVSTWVVQENVTYPHFIQ